jgi:hypothetical protein
MVRIWKHVLSVTRWNGHTHAETEGHLSPFAAKPAHVIGLRV